MYSIIGLDRRDKMLEEIKFLRSGIAKELKKLRIENDYTQEDVSLKSGVNIGTIVRYEQGSVTASLDKLCEILEIYNIDLHIFFKLIYEKMYRNNN
jgi:transcriptional regulator with XRE-family HTH domain